MRAIDSYLCTVVGRYLARTPNIWYSLDYISKTLGLNKLGPNAFITAGAGPPRWELMTKNMNNSTSIKSTSIEVWACLIHKCWNTCLTSLLMNFKHKCVSGGYQDLAPGFHQVFTLIWLGMYRNCNGTPTRNQLGHKHVTTWSVAQKISAQDQVFEFDLFSSYRPSNQFKTYQNPQSSW